MSERRGIITVRERYVLHPILRILVGSLWLACHGLFGPGFDGMG